MRGFRHRDHEVEKYDGSAGTVVAWVRIPTLHTTGDTINMYYGNIGIIGPTQNAAGVWSNGFREVWHLHETSGGTVADSTSSGYTGTVSGGVNQNPATEKIDGADGFDGSSGVLILNDGTLTANSSLTFEGWFYLSADLVSPVWPGIVTKYRDFPGTMDWVGLYANYDTLYGCSYPCLALGWGYADGRGGNLSSTTHLAAGQWYYAAATFDQAASGARALYLNGLVEASDSGAHYDVDLTLPSRIGHDGLDVHFNGFIDEARISSVGRNECWVGSTYNSITSPATVGAEQALLYGYSQPITIKDLMTPASCGAALSNFPILVSIANNANLKTVSHGGHVQNANGYDIIFTDSNGAQLDHEIEQYDGNGGTLVAWVRIPTLAYNADTTIYLNYGNASITLPTANPTGVWNTSNSWRGVWHLSETPADGTTGGHKDSTSLANNGTPRDFQDGDGGSTNATGIADGADRFATGSPADDRVEIPDDSSLEPSGDMTVEAWVNLNSLPANSHIVYKSNSGSPSLSYMIYVDASVGRPRFQWYNSSGTPYDVGLSSGSLATSTWYHLVGVHDGTTLRMYVNGSNASTSTATTSGTLLNSDQTLNIGASWSGGTCPDGLIDEVRVSAIARDACWIGTEYNTVQYATDSTYIDVGAEAAKKPTVADVVSLSATEGSGGRVLVSWRTGFEVDNLGFHVYREVDGERVRVTPGLVAGSALFAGAGTALTAGRSYAWWDSSPVAGASYWVEEWELSGERRWHGPVLVQPAAMDAVAEAVPSALLSDLFQPNHQPRPQCDTQPNPDDIRYYAPGTYPAHLARRFYHLRFCTGDGHRCHLRNPIISLHRSSPDALFSSPRN